MDYIERRNLRSLFPNSVRKTIEELQPLAGITKRKLDKLMSYVYNVDVKTISRSVLTSLKKGKTREILDKANKHDNTLSTKVYGFCGCVGSGNKNEYDPLQKCVNKKRGTKSKTNKSNRNKSRRKTKRSKKSCSKKGKRRSKKSRKRRNKKKSQRRRSKGGKSRKRGCTMRHGRKPCKSGKCRRKKTRSRRRSNVKTCGPITVIYPPMITASSNESLD